MNNFYLGLEFGSTRIKSVLVDVTGKVIVSGGYTWENQLKDGYWTYAKDDVIHGMQVSFQELKQAYEQKFGEKLATLGSIGISGMMHGYIPTDDDGNWLTDFRTWRNTSASEAAAKLSEAMGRYIPPRWSASHLYQAALNQEKHLQKVTHIYTLASYVHFLLTGEIVIGLCEGSGMFPVLDGEYRPDCMKIYKKMYKEAGQTADPEAFFPRLLPAGADAGKLTEEGARLLDISGDLRPGILLCPPEGDAATGMVCTNSVAQGTANVSAGTSAFLMAVLEPKNAEVAKHGDHIVTPDGLPVAMIHENNCTGNINRYERLFAEVAKLCGGSDTDLFTKMFTASKNADSDAGKIVDYPFFSGEPILKASESGLVSFSEPDGELTLGNLMKALLCSATAPLAYGVRELYKNGVSLSRVAGHGGFFKTPEVGAKIMSAALKSPIFTAETAAEGGAYGMALLALFAAKSQDDGLTLQDDGLKLQDDGLTKVSVDAGLSLPEFLQQIYADAQTKVEMASEKEQAEYDAYLERYLAHLPGKK